MVLRELQNLVNSLVKAGHGDRLMVKSRDEEGNGFEEISSLEISPSIGEGRDLDIVCKEDILAGEYDDCQVTDVICIW